MKKVLSAALALALCALCLAGCGGKDEAAVSLAGARTQFYLGQSFETGGLTVTAAVDGQRRALAAGEYEVDSSAFDGWTAGEYEIVVRVPASGESASYTVRVDERYRDSLKILAVGNSFSDDATELLPKLVKSAGGGEIVVGNLRRDGCSLSEHAARVLSGAADYTYRKSTGDGWTEERNRSLADGFADEAWDVVVLQQVSGLSGVATSYERDLKTLVDFAARQAPDAELAFHMTWAYQQNSTHPDFSRYGSDQRAMYEAILSAVREMVLPVPQIKTIIPSGTAIQAARAGSFGDTLTRDGYHLTLTEGRYIAAMTWLKSLTGWDLTSLKWTPAGISASEREEIKTLVAAAAKNPFGLPV